MLIILIHCLLLRLLQSIEMEKHVIVRKWNIYERFVLYGLVGFAAEVNFNPHPSKMQILDLFYCILGSCRVWQQETDWCFLYVHIFRLRHNDHDLWKVISEIRGSVTKSKMMITIQTLLPIYLRAVVYVLVTYAWEFSSGYILNQWDACPWDYRRYSQETITTERDLVISVIILWDW